jgi:hypothetical protein
MVAQIVDDTVGKTVASASTLEADLRAFDGDKVAKAKKVGLEGRSGGDGLANRVVDDLSHHVAVRARHNETGASRGAGDLLAKTKVTTLTRNRLALAKNLDSHHLPAFPTLRRTISPA